MKQFNRLFLAIVFMMLMSFDLCAAKDLSLEDVTSSLRAKRMSAVTPLVDGESYAVLQDNKKIVKCLRPQTAFRFRSYKHHASDLPQQDIYSYLKVFATVRALYLFGLFFFWLNFVKKIINHISGEIRRHIKIKLKIT